ADAFVQDNHSRSARGVLRGLHYQEPNAQGKLVRCTRGAIFDVAVDIRRGSPSFGRWFGLALSDANKLMLWIPPGFAHGFCAIEDDLASRSARGNERERNSWPRRRPPQVHAPRNFVAAASAAAHPGTPEPRAERGAELLRAPSRERCPNAFGQPASLSAVSLRSASPL